MIQTHSQTAQRTESLKLSEPSDGRTNERYRLHEQAKDNPYVCEECGAPVHSGKGNDRWVLCYPHGYLYGEWEEAANVARGKQAGETRYHSPSGTTSLEALRRERGMGRTALARASGVNTSTIRHYETGRTAFLRPATRKALWEALGEGEV